MPFSIVMSLEAPRGTSGHAPPPMRAGLLRDRLRHASAHRNPELLVTNLEQGALAAKRPPSRQELRRLPRLRDALELAIGATTDAVRLAGGPGDAKEKITEHRRVRQRAPRSEHIRRNPVPAGDCFTLGRHATREDQGGGRAHTIHARARPPGNSSSLRQPQLGRSELALQMSARSPCACNPRNCRFCF